MPPIRPEHEATPNPKFLQQFLARDVIYTSRAYATMPVRLSVCL